MRITLLILASFLIFAQSSHAQEKGVFKLSAGAAYGSKAGADDNGEDSKGVLGFNIGAEYFVSDVVSIAPSYSQFAKSSIEDPSIGLSIKAWISAINVDLRYYFSTDGTLFYALAGYSSVKAIADFQGLKFSASENGFNLGLGTVIPVGEKVGINLQGKYQKASDFDQFVINAGVVFRLK